MASLVLGVSSLVKEIRARYNGKYQLVKDLYHLHDVNEKNKYKDCGVAFAVLKKCEKLR